MSRAAKRPADEWVDVLTDRQTSRQAASATHIPAVSRSRGRAAALAARLRHGESLPALAAILFAIVALAIGFGRAWPLALDVGTHDQRFVGGFNEVEDLDGTHIRWTAGDSTIALPRPPDGAASILALRLLNIRPTGSATPLLKLSADQQPLGAFDVTREIAGGRIYRVLTPADTRLDWAKRFELASDTITPPNDARPLGVVVDWATLAPVRSAPLLPSTWLLLWGAGLGALTYALPRSIGLGRRLAWGVAAAIAVLVAWGIAARPMEILPFVQRIAALFGLGCLGLVAARLLTLPRLESTRRPLVRGADLPIYLAVAWWLGPLFQLVMTADGASGVTPPLPTVWIGAVAALLLIAIGGWYALRGRALPRERSAARVRQAALAVLAVAALAHLAYMLWFAFQRQGPDFWILFKGARDWARGGSLYDLDAITTNHFGHVFKVPPFYGMLFVPFVFQDGERILFFHRVLNTLLIGATALAWFRMWRLRLFSLAGAGVLVLLNFRPLADTLAFGQIDLALLLILTLALWALRDERDLSAGALIALGTLFKIYPVLLLAFFVVKRRWRALAGFALGMLVLNGLAVAVMGWDMNRVYVTEVLPRIGGSTSWVENQTISGFLARLIDAPTEAAIFRDRAITLLGMAISGIVVLLACVLALRPARADSTDYALQYSQFPLLMVLVAPAAWMHYETLLFIPFAALLLHLRDREVGLARAAALALSFALIAYGNQWSFFDGTVMGVLTIAGVSYKFYGMLLLGGVLAGTLLEQRAALWATLRQGRTLAGWASSALRNREA